MMSWTKKVILEHIHRGSPIHPVENFLEHLYARLLQISRERMVVHVRRVSFFSSKSIAFGKSIAVLGFFLALRFFLAVRFLLTFFRDIQRFSSKADSRLLTLDTSPHTACTSTQTFLRL